ncbi:MAG: hypothetical protein HC767_05695 [Akkermansiaceae bacterium]|nr:hypothetical protein [Akkermansiaceae bacterium]
MTGSDDGWIEDGENTFSLDGFFGLCCLGFEEVERDAPQGGEVLRGIAFFRAYCRLAVSSKKARTSA